MSYLIHPVPGKEKELQVALNRLPGCESFAAYNSELLILITDTLSEEDEWLLQTRLDELPELHGLTLVSSFAESAL